MKKLLASPAFVIISLIAHCQEFTPTQVYGGKVQLKTFIDQELIYPEPALQSETEGTVLVLYHISEKGQVSHVRYDQKLSPECDLEALRIFRMLEWEPARRRGVAVADSGQFTIEFNIKKYNRLCKKRGYNSLYFPYEPIDTSGRIYFYKNLESAPHPIFTNEGITLAGFIAANLKYPEAAIKQNISGIVTLAFVVEPHGRISNTHIVNSLGAGCNEEALRILQMIKWMPGTLNHQAVRTRMRLSVNFNLEPGPDGNFNPNVKSSYGG